MNFESVQDLVNAYKKKTGRHFFDEQSLRFAGMSISEMRLSKRIHKVLDFEKKAYNCYCIKLDRESEIIRFYFDKETLELVIV